MGKKKKKNKNKNLFKKDMEAIFGKDSKKHDYYDEFMSMTNDILDTPFDLSSSIEEYASEIEDFIMDAISASADELGDPFEALAFVSNTVDGVMKRLTLSLVGKHVACDNIPYVVSGVFDTNTHQNVELISATGEKKSATIDKLTLASTMTFDKRTNPSFASATAVSNDDNKVEEKVHIDIPFDLYSPEERAEKEEKADNPPIIEEPQETQEEIDEETEE